MGEGAPQGVGLVGQHARRMRRIGLQGEIQRLPPIGRGDRDAAPLRGLFVEAADEASGVTERKS
jgi:hypothetical protein